MIETFVAHITGDNSELKKVIKESKSEIKSIGNDDYVIKLNYDGNIKDFNKEFDKMAKACPELVVQFQYNINQKMLNKEMDKLKTLKDLKLDVETGEANKKIATMVNNLREAVKSDTTDDIIAAKIKGIYKYANTISELGGKVSDEYISGIYDAVAGTRFEPVIDKIVDKLDTSKLKLFNFKKPIDEEISATEDRIEEFQKFLEHLETKGASKSGMTSELQDLQEEVKILRSDLADMKDELNTVSGESFNRLKSDIQGVVEQIDILTEKISFLSDGKTMTVGDVVNRWTKKNTDDIERYTPYNRNTKEAMTAELSGEYNNIPGKLVRSAIESAKFVVDGFIHSHPEKIAAMSDNDLELYFELFKSGVTEQVVTSLEQAMTLDLDKIKMDKSDDIMEDVLNKFESVDQILFGRLSEIKQQVEEDFRISDKKFGEFNINETNLILNEFRSQYTSFMDSLGDSFGLNEYVSNLGQTIVSIAKNNESFKRLSKQKQGEVAGQLQTYITAMAFSAKTSAGEIFADEFQQGYQDALIEVFSNPKYLKDGVSSAIKVESLTDFISNMLEPIGEEGGKGIVDGFRKGIDAHSNSKEAERAVDDFANGVVDEFEKRTDDMVQAAKKAGDAVTEAFNNSVKDSFDELDEVYAHEAESRDSMQGYDTPLYSEADIDRIYSRHDDVILGYQHDIDDLQDELRDAEDNNRDLIEENRELRRKLGNSKSLSPIEQFYKDYGIPSHAMDMGYNPGEVLRMLGGRFMDMDPDAEDYSEKKLDAEFFKELIKGANLAEDKLEVVKAAFIEIDDYAEGGRFRHLAGDFTANSYVSDQLKLIKEIIDGEHEITELEKSNAKSILKYTSENNISSFLTSTEEMEEKVGQATDQARQGLAEIREEAEKTEEAIVNQVPNETQALFKEQAESIEQNQNDIQEEIRETVGEIDNLIEKEKEISSVQLPAVIPLIDNQAQARDAFNKDVRNELFTDGNAKQSGELIEYEAKALDVLDKNAADAAESKNKFATANIAVLKSIIDSVAGLDNEVNAFKALNKLIGDFANADDESIRHIADNIKILRDALNEHIDDNSLLNALKELSQQGVNLKDLSSSIKNAKKQVESNTKSVIDPATFKTDIDNQIHKIDYLLDKGKYVEGFKEKLKTLRKSLDDLSDTGASDESVKKLKEITREISEFSRQATLAENKATNGKSISKLLGQINDILSKNTSAKFKRTNVYKDLIDYQEQLKSFDTSRTKAEFNKLSDAVLRTIAEFKELDQTTRGSGFLGKVSNRLADLNAKFFAQYLSFHDLIRYARTAVTTIIDLDTQLVDLRKTTKMNDTELEEFYKNSSNVAKQLGVTTSEIISQASAWSRLGFNTKEASTEMAKLSSQFASISPGMTTDEAQTGLVSIMKAWDVDVSKVSRDIMDNINTLGLYKAQTYSNVRCQIN